MLEGILESLLAVMCLDLLRKFILGVIGAATTRAFGKSGSFFMSSQVGTNNFNTSFCLSLFFCLSDVRVDADLEFEPDDRLDWVPLVVSSTTLPLRGSLLLSCQRFTQAHSVRLVHVAFVEFTASLSGTFHKVAYSRDDGSAALKKKKTHTHKINNAAY
jgi:hypothetical protein